MWVVIKFKKNEINLLKKDFLSKLGNETKFFLPKIKLQKRVNNKLSFKENFLLNNYLICFHPFFKKISTINILKHCRGLQYFLSDFCNSQKEILEFIKKCEKHKDANGYIKQSFFNFEKKSFFQFISGPFTNLVFKIISEQDKFFNINLEGFKTIVSKDKYLFRPV